MDEKDKKFEKRDNPIGAIWNKKSKIKSEEYISGTISLAEGQFDFVGFKNGFKETPNDPDWRLFVRKNKPA